MRGSKLGQRHDAGKGKYMIKINGVEVAIRESMTLLELLEEKQYSMARIAVELNEAIVPKKAYADTILRDGDVLEVVSFVGGG